MAAHIWILVGDKRYGNLRNPHFVQTLKSIDTTALIHSSHSLYMVLFKAVREKMGRALAQTQAGSSML